MWEFLAHFEMVVAAIRPGSSDTALGSSPAITCSEIGVVLILLKRLESCGSIRLTDQKVCSQSSGSKTQQYAVCTSTKNKEWVYKNIQLTGVLTRLYGTSQKVGEKAFSRVYLCEWAYHSDSVSELVGTYEKLTRSEQRIKRNHF